MKLLQVILFAALIFGLKVANASCSASNASPRDRNPSKEMEIVDHIVGRGHGPTEPRRDQTATIAPEVVVEGQSPRG